MNPIHPEMSITLAPDILNEGSESRFSEYLLKGLTLGLILGLLRFLWD
jgi:hypothetical protein